MLIRFFYDKKSALYNLSGTFVNTVYNKLFMINSFIMTVSFRLISLFSDWSDGAFQNGYHNFENHRICME